MEKLIQDLQKVNELIEMLNARVKCYTESNETFYKVFGKYGQKQKDLDNCKRIAERLNKSRVRILTELQNAIALELTIV